MKNKIIDLDLTRVMREGQIYIKGAGAVVYLLGIKKSEFRVEVFNVRDKTEFEIFETALRIYMRKDDEDAAESPQGPDRPNYL